MRPFLLAALLTAPLSDERRRSGKASLVVALAVAAGFAGCFSDGGEPQTQAVVAESAEEAGAVAGPAPVAPKDAYAVKGATDAQTVTVHPVGIETNAAKAPYSKEFTGVYETQECVPSGELPLGGLGLAESSEAFDVTEAFTKNDVFSYEVTLTWTATDGSWAELHLWHAFDGVSNFWSEPTGEGRGEVTINFTGQGFIVNEEFFAAVGVSCWYGFITQPIPFTIRVDVAYAEGAVPSQVPMLLHVPEGATTLFVSGVALDDAAPVLSHYRVFGPDDELVCECALNSNEPLDTLELPLAGDYVVLVDHTANGFVALGLDTPPREFLRPLSTTFARYPLAASDGGALDETLALEIPSTPLNIWAWVFAPGPIEGNPDAGVGHNVKITLSNARGDVLRMGLVGYATFHAAVPGLLTTNDWYAVPIDGEWEFFEDHHALAPGPHQATVKAEQMRGEAVLFAQHYERP